MTRRDPLARIPASCAMHELERCVACSAPILERPLGGRPAVWDAIGCAHRLSGCSVSYELHTPDRCERIRAYYDAVDDQERLAGLDAKIDRAPAAGTWGDAPTIRPVSVRKVDGTWTIYDHGGGLLIRHGLLGGLAHLPTKDVCCWDAAQGMADALARHYRGELPPAWAARGGHPPVRPGRSRCRDFTWGGL